ncbi:glycoside-pentoside-hexuronide (GPH):cation symporter [Neobacillus sp. CF12]|uniref:MFS transporter n=1 Tax=Neobacillus sp. CF12 TaxID=3055864 RepID=UPI0025A19691|nr:glycoside-pentoside-hexuronide (GPH):cation symporter [Neobacillus sp. CF12]MDM5327516.1 glycoside-pentoside-hexuronide (GPH):cation symporter [Neobacillus sp. CF12]
MQATEVTQNQSVSVIHEEDRKLTFREKVAATIGNMMGVMHNQIIATFLLFFYTDIMEISPAYVAGLFLFARIIDAMLVPVFGVFVDKVTTPWGKYVPYFLILGVPTAIFGWLTFTDFGLSPTGKLIYISITYLVYSILISIKYAPNTAVGPAITKRIDDRISMGQIGYILIMVGALFASLGFQPLYKALGGGSDAKGFSFMMGIVAVIGILVSVFQVTSLKERYIDQNSKEKVRLSFKEMNVAVFSNKAAVVLYVYILAINLANGIRAAIMIHYFKYYFNNEGLLVTYGAVSVLPTVIGVMLSGPITKRFGIKINVLTAAIVNVVCTASVMFIPNTSTGVTLFLALNVIAAFFLGLATPAQGSMMPAAMDYSEWKTGMNVSGFMGSIQGFVQTLATAISGAIAAGALHFVGYVPGVEQTSETIFGLKLLMGILPAVVLIFTLSLVWFDITEEKQKQIARDLAERRQQNAL